jgi:hypothetical protein
MTKPSAEGNSPRYAAATSARGDAPLASRIAHGTSGVSRSVPDHIA